MTTESKSTILRVGDLVRLKHSDSWAPFYTRPHIGEVGIIIEVQHSTFLGIIYYVHTIDGIWRFSDYEVELLNGSR